MRINEIINPSFEGGTQQWQGSDATIERIDGGAVGSHALRFRGQGTGRGRIESHPQIKVVPGRTYTFSGHYRIPSSLSVPHYIGVEFYDNDTNWNYIDATATPLAATGNGWTRFHVTFKVPAGATGAYPYPVIAQFGSVTSVNDVIEVDGLLFERGELNDYFDGGTAGYEWSGEEGNSRSQTIPRLNVGKNVRLEVEVGGSWVNITGPTKNITIDRGDGDVGLLTAEVLDADLDPLKSSSLRMGRTVRVSAGRGEDWTPIYTGRVDNVKVTYNPLAKGKKTANVAISASDNVAYLANQTEPRGVDTISDLRGIVTGIDFDINGATTGTTNPVIVSRNENASLWEQVLVTRDSNLGYAWVDKDNRLKAYSHDLMDTTVKAVLSPDVYANLDIDFDLSQIINSVVVNWLRYDIGTETATAVPYGPYEDANSIAEWGRQQVSFTVQGQTEVAAQIQAFATDVLNRSSNAEVRPQTATLVLRSVTDLVYANLDLNDRVNVVFHDGETTKEMRVTGIKHSISANRWSIDYEFALPLGLTAPSTSTDTGVPNIPVGGVKEENLDPEVKESFLYDAAAAAQAAIDDAVAEIDIPENTGNATFYQTTKPSGGTYKKGDMWFDTDDANRIYVHNGTDFVLATQSYLSTPNGKLTISPNGLYGYDASNNLTIGLNAYNGSLVLNGPVTSGGSITGANITASSSGVIQTESTWNRGIKMNSNGLVAYDSSGNPTFTITNSTGAVAMKGTLTAGSNISGATITGSSFTTNTAGNPRITMGPGSGLSDNEIAMYNANSVLPGVLSGDALSSRQSTFLTSPTGVSGNQRAQISLTSWNASGTKDIQFIADTISASSATLTVGAINTSSISPYTGSSVNFYGNISAANYTVSATWLSAGYGGLSSSGGVNISNGGLTVNGNATFNNHVNLTSTSGHSMTGTNGSFKLPNYSTVNNTGLQYLTRAGSDGSVYAHSTTTSRRDKKKYISDLHIDTDAVLAITPRKFQWRVEGLIPGTPAFWDFGVIADEVEEIGGLEVLLTREEDGELEGFRYDRLAIAHQLVLKEQQERIKVLESQVQSLMNGGT